MSVDFAALTAAVGAGLSEVRACLIVSRDGLALGSYPSSEEGGAMERWMRLASLGDVERGFAVVGEECWVFCTRGPYSALAVARATGRPGIILERLDQAVLAAEEARLRKDGIGSPGGRDPAGSAAAARRRRPSTPPTGVHPQGTQSPRPERVDVRMPGQPDARTRPAPGAGTAPRSQVASGAAGGSNPPAPEANRSRGPEGRSETPEPDEEKVEPSGQRTFWRMDADDLTKEFAGLLEDPDDPGRY
jgi:hypothetical protein